MTENLHSAAQAYLDARLCVLPARRSEKRPAVATWKQYQKRLPKAPELDAWLANGPDAVCILCGDISGNLEMIDFDAGAAFFARWAEIVRTESRRLFERLVIERTQRNGRHVVYRSAIPVCGNQKLAQRRGQDGKLETLIETRGEGGLFLCAPTPGYELLQGSLTNVPVLTEGEREILLNAAWSLNEYLPPAQAVPMTSGAVGRPGDDFNQRGDIRPALLKHGWMHVRTSGGNEYWRRPGKDTDGWSASLKDQVLYVYSSNAAPFEPNKGYSPFHVYALLEHGGDFSAAAAALRVQGYGADSSVPGVDISAIVSSAPPVPPAPRTEDPGPTPIELLRIPGLVSEVMDFCLETAPYPNVTMAFCGALALQSFLGARKVRDPGDNRTNLYLLGLGYSSAGKEWPRRINTRILHEIQLGDCWGDKFASGEGLQDALFLTPAMLFQTDEIDTMLQSMSKSKDARFESLMGTLLTMYTSSASIYPMRRKAGSENPGSIDQPSLTIFGTAVPTHYYEALSARMLTNGLFARMLVLEAGQRGDGQEPSIRSLPQRVIDTAHWWADFQPGGRKGNLLAIHPEPLIVEHAQDAKALLVENRQEAAAQYKKAECQSEEVGTTVWGRVSENVRKLSLIHAISENYASPVISRQAVRWAIDFVEHQTKRMLFMASQHVAENPFHAECLKVIRKLQSEPGRQIQRQHLMRFMHCKSGDFDQIIGTLLQQGDILPVEIPTKTRPAQGYRLP